MPEQTRNQMLRSPIRMTATVLAEQATGREHRPGWLKDMSLAPRLGIRGRNADTCLRQLGLPIPDAPNQAVDADTETVLRLSPREYWLLAHSAQQELPDISAPDNCHAVSCADSHAHFLLKPPCRAGIMAKVCGVDLRTDSFPVGTIAQTVVAGVSAIVVHHRIGTDAVFSLLCERPVAQYLWDVLIDAMQEFSGSVTVAAERE